jgi:hypothetical protein
MQHQPIPEGFNIQSPRIAIRGKAASHEPKHWIRLMGGGGEVHQEFLASFSGRYPDMSFATTSLFIFLFSDIYYFNNSLIITSIES